MYEFLTNTKFFKEKRETKDTIVLWYEYKRFGYELTALINVPRNSLEHELTWMYRVKTGNKILYFYDNGKTKQDVKNLPKGKFKNILSEVVEKIEKRDRILRLFQ